MKIVLNEEQARRKREGDEKTCVNCKSVIELRMFNYPFPDYLKKLYYCRKCGIYKVILKKNAPPGAYLSWNSNVTLEVEADENSNE
jgi:hypothetical protein